ncbi:CAP domain-containing protein [Actinoplanes teichomyceticus]|uniref:Uncharacterized protein YkwD n=1 Tax=Actinoplanes teichomyceticus TaxID=1867 RepID=A0A561VKH6_ACTTI|nr:CAP domain-containing protein [Actinoplanes teichomyceticus]TWG12135.1 uncharacterized protein YkwD [Actinoplanes teichomyceticus]GIF14066.1 hypothetical protein Ate01nite_40980 [Actinoplanes teichomyceticus]
MRKPLVVLGVAAALITGGVVATRALAQEPPDDSAGVTASGLPLSGGDRPAGSPPAGPDAGPAISPPAAAGTPAPPLDAPPAAPADPPADAPTRSPADAPTRSPAGGPARVLVDRAPAERPAETRIRPVVRPRNDVAGAAVDPIAASHTAVTARSVSSSPRSPVQQQILALVNRQRERSGCRPVTLDRRLIEAANRHAADMARREYFEHTSPNGDRAGERVSEAGYHWRWYGENIARGQESPWEAMDGWMNSPQHRENIVDCRLDEMGVGLALDRDRTPYWVQDFATPK